MSPTSAAKGRRNCFQDSADCALRHPGIRPSVIQPCTADGLLDDLPFAIDASLIAVDANKRRALAGSNDVRPGGDCKGPTVSWGEYLDALDQVARGAASETVPKFISCRFWPRNGQAFTSDTPRLRGYLAARNELPPRCHRRCDHHQLGRASRSLVADLGKLCCIGCGYLPRSCLARRRLVAPARHRAAQPWRA